MTSKTLPGRKALKRYCLIFVLIVVTYFLYNSNGNVSRQVNPNERLTVSAVKDVERRLYESDIKYIQMPEDFNVVHKKEEIKIDLSGNEQEIVYENVDKLKSFNLHKEESYTCDISTSDEDVHVVISFDREYIKPAMVAIESILQNSRTSEKMYFHLIVEPQIIHRVSEMLFKGFPEICLDTPASDPNFYVTTDGHGYTSESANEEDRKGIISDPDEDVRLGTTRVQITYIHDNIVPKHKVWYGPRNLMNDLNYARFVLTDLFPTLSKIVYLDPDVIVQGDVALLYKGYLQKVNGKSKYTLAAVPGASKEKYGKFIINNKVAKVDPGETYFNAGVMLIDLARWKATGASKQVNKWLKLNLETPVYKYGSQPPLMLAFYRKYEKLPMKWNFRHLGHKTDLERKDIKSAHILHFNGPRKPWMNNGIERYIGYWDKYYQEFRARVKDPLLLEWGFQDIQESYRDVLYKSCYKQQECIDENKKRDDARYRYLIEHTDLSKENTDNTLAINMVVDASPDSTKWTAVINDFYSQWNIFNDPNAPWNFYWIRKQSDLNARLKSSGFDINMAVSDNQKVNYIPGLWDYSYHKDVFCKQTQRWMRQNDIGEDTRDSNAGFIPCYNLPEQYDDYITYAKGNPDKVWISKLTDSSSGKGMDIYPNPESIPEEDYFNENKRVMQEYIKEPFLINKKKIDARVYIVITSLDPLRLYIHSSGQVKSAQKDDKTLREKNEILEIMGRMDLEDLASRIAPEKWADVWGKVESLITRTVMATFKDLGCNSEEFPYPCGSGFQMFGVDIVFDKGENPHLIEMNSDSSDWGPFFELQKYINEHPGSSDKNFQHDTSNVEMTFRQVYGDLIHLTGVKKYSPEYTDKVADRYDYLCKNSEMPTICGDDDVKRIFIDMANELGHAGSFKMIFPTQDYKKRYRYDLYKGRVGEDIFTAAYDLFINYFSLDFQDAHLYRKRTPIKK